MDDKDKYRLWDEENKQMHYDDFVITSTGFAAKITEVSPNIFQFDQSDLEFDKKMKKMRCIGLKDKDGTLIYQGDIVKSHLYEYSFEVVWVQSLAHFELLSYIDNRKGLGILSSEDIDKYQMWRIIGNIYENAELLEER